MTERDIPWELSADEQAVLFGILYADVFHFAPTAEELVRYLPLKACTREQILTGASGLCEKGCVVQDGEYLVLAGREELVRQRHQRIEKQEQLWGHVDEHLPDLVSHKWIRAAFVTGSLAAGNADREADVDLFLVLSKNHSWIGYYYLRWIKKRNPGLQFCTNYIISDNELSLLDPNLYTAIEWSMSVPVKGAEMLKEMEACNPWVREWIPGVEGFQARMRSMPPAGKRHSLVDGLLKSPLGWLADHFLYRWVKFRSGGKYVPRRGTFKPHPPMRQKKVIEEVLSRMDRLNLAWPEVRDHLGSCVEQLQRESDRWSSPDEEERSRIASVMNPESEKE